MGEPEGKARTEQHLAACAACRSRRDQLAVAPAQQSDMIWFRRQRRAPLFAGIAAAVAAAAALVLFAGPGKIEQPAGDTRLKGGGLSFEVVARRGDGRVEAVFDGTALRPGDAIRFVVTAPEAGHAAVVGLDGAGRVSVYAPAEGAPPALAAGRHELPGSVVLDETPGDERLVALLCAPAPARAALTEAGTRALAAAKGDPRQAPPLELPCRQTALSIHKDVAR